MTINRIAQNLETMRNYFSFYAGKITLVYTLNLLLEKYPVTKVR